ncbi:ATP-binding protein [Maribacter polysaccharolyticus]|uniref:ATP-binding protein n=1 Tax=Maribacter polysaccharolyticus TaxID=3020831 RepID=UPI00237F3889|nr:HAMP domain-containing sensor histidine kinase [Maribacter polysaccharolyticus]MDE3741325.1 HAMP domain-containing sensor histidine kinase [Maribacter polysaccharolyticus]
MLGFIKSSTNQLKRLIDGLLEYSKSESLIQEDVAPIEIEVLKDDISGLFSYDNSLKLKFHSPLKTINTNKTALNQILINLVSNAIKYSDKEETEMQITVDKKGNHYEFSVKDSGPGIAKEHQE